MAKARATKKAPAKKAPGKKPPAKKPVAKKAPAAKQTKAAKPAAKPAQRWGARADKGAPIAGYIAKLSGEQRAIADKLVEIIESAVPNAQAALKWGMPMWTIDDQMLTYFRAQKYDVRFGLAAAGLELDDPHGVLFGSSDGKHVRLVNVAQIDAPRLAGWIRAVAASRNG